MKPEQHRRLDALFRLSPELGMAALEAASYDRDQPHWLRSGKPGSRKTNRKKKAKDRRHRRDVKRQKRAQR